MIELKIDAQICSNQTVVDTKACKSAFFFIFRNVYTEENYKNSDYFFQRTQENEFRVHFHFHTVACLNIIVLT